MAVKPPPPGRRRVPAPPPKGQDKKATKSFSGRSWGKNPTGEKIVIYAPSKMGKTTLAAMAPKPVFLPFDDGSRKVLSPITGEPLEYASDSLGNPPETFQDLRDALNSSQLCNMYETFVIDTVTMVQNVCEPHIFATIKKAESGARVTNLEGYGYGKGYKHLLDCIRLLLVDCDQLVNKNKNVILLAQQHAVRIANTAGEDYLQDGPDLFHNNQYSVRNEVIAWADHIVRLGLVDVTISNKKAFGTDTRALFLRPEPHFVAGSRTLDPVEYDVISFETKQDASFWKILFGE